MSGILRRSRRSATDCSRMDTNSLPLWDNLHYAHAGSSPVEELCLCLLQHSLRKAGWAGGKIEDAAVLLSERLLC